MGPTAELLNALKGRLASVEVVDADGKVTGRSFAEVLSWEYPSDTPTTTLPAVVEKKKLCFSVAYRTETTEETRKLTYEELRVLLNDKQSHAHTVIASIFDNYIPNGDYAAYDCVLSKSNIPAFEGMVNAFRGVEKHPGGLLVPPCWILAPEQH